MRRHVGNATVVILVSIASATVQTWSPQGHRLVALATSRGDRWRDCVVDRIRYNQERLADATLDRADRAIALKFLVHLIGDVHQPFHARGVARGGSLLIVGSAIGDISRNSNGRSRSVVGLPSPPAHPPTGRWNRTRRRNRHCCRNRVPSTRRTTARIFPPSTTAWPRAGCDWLRC